MNKHAILIAAAALCFLLAIHTQAKFDDSAGVPTISVTKLDINDKTLKLSYEIRNASNEDIWVLVGFGRSDMIFEVFMGEDDQTLLIRARLDFPLIYTSLQKLHGRYALLRTGQIRTESVTLTIPVHPAYPFGSGRRERGLEHATRLAVKIGYYAGDLPGMIQEIIEKPAKIGGRTKISHDKLMRYYFTGPLHFNRVNETLKERDEEILIPYTGQNLVGEKVLQMVVENLAIPYDEKYVVYEKPESPGIPPCSRIEIEFLPSMLEYYFPYAGQRDLLSASEQQILRPSCSVIVEGQDQTQAFVNDINKMAIVDGVVRQRSPAQLVCYRGTQHVTSFNVFDENCIVTDACNRYVPTEGLWGLEKFTPQIKPFELRVRCAANLRNLWYRLRLHYKATGKTSISYPAPVNWCDALVRLCKTKEMWDEDFIRDEQVIGPYICPAAGDRDKYLAESCYAMNSNCRADSPSDMVLLFETKAGWNQYGGPELFTFDNHDPKGGCVLLNDGTVKFVRTEEELRKLRWK